MEKNYILVKGWCGFADRLQALSHAMNYAKYSRRIISVDWSDLIWSGNNNINFDDFFYIEGIQYIRYDELLQLNITDVYPPVWSNNIGKKPDRYVYGANYDIDLHVKDGKFTEYTSKLIIYPSVKNRVYHRYNLSNYLDQ